VPDCRIPGKRDPGTRLPIKDDSRYEVRRDIHAEVFAVGPPNDMRHSRCGLSAHLRGVPVHASVSHVGLARAINLSREQLHFRPQVL
jgi:hypothetical protein